mmetsp:Transcript_70626/g.147940  ORF Transcript_70626/g.147940 Transcript_70626/m.147940 type:complete len:647 (+) Transcript_70626:229-2169(+)|eukprot:CAMPEP_0206428568 /NCGR_PEP_ID=MMETSP0324_2-20121206/5748_1 /ASSEMBLY_ACC=CAM_ASM_000836 /TAXON_ID=2866 /ORGANISM="Crypthecodinium cohnii, Strain Seligo" /LENGTH=646 /DNA_ID=CAMNT_0053894133 /DNA_START=164 /DNA_END=2104 /DNA_ORIENTATION=-
MDDDLDRAARKQRLMHRQEANRAQQRMKPVEAQGMRGFPAAPANTPAPATTATATASVRSPAVVSPSPSASGVSCSVRPTDPDFRTAVQAKFKELVLGGMDPNLAASKAITMVREAATAPVVSDAGAFQTTQVGGSSSSSAPPPPQGGGGAGGALKRFLGTTTSTTTTTSKDAEEMAFEADLLSPGGCFTCFICIEEKQPTERFLPHKCSAKPERLCCKPCYVAWVESQIDSEAADIRCCHCDLLLDARSLARLVDAEHWQKHCDAALQLLLRRDSCFIWCPKCTGGGWVDKTKATSKCGWICPECSASFVYCPYCRREHGSLTCKRFQQLRTEVFTKKKAESEKQSEGMVQRNAKTCPSCQMPIQKDGGCNYMDCPNCRRHFCWSCGTVLQASHQKHKCDAGVETSKVMATTPGGMPCLELTRMFTNVLNIDDIQLLNVDEADYDDIREMLVPGITQERRQPLFVGPSACDGELVVHIPFNFAKALTWDLTHFLIRAHLPPAPHSYPPRSLDIIPNLTTCGFSDFDQPGTASVELKDMGDGIYSASLEKFRTKGTFRRTVSLSLRFSVASVPTGPDMEREPHEDSQAEVYFNDLAIFGLPGESGAAARKHTMYDDRANLIISPVLKSRWGTQEEVEAEVNDEDEG